MGERDEAYFDDWHSRVGAGASEVDALWGSALGLPPGVVSNSLLTGAGLDEVEGLLALRPGQVLLDLACGRGAFGIELARRSGARVVGLDFAASAVRMAVGAAERWGLADRAEFRVADMADTGLSDESVDAAMCIDAAQFVEPPSQVADEVLRVLRAGGRAVFTGWEARTRGDRAVPERLRHLDFEKSLLGAGFERVEVTSREDWLAVETAAWQRVVDAPSSSDPHLTSLQEEGRTVLARPFAVRRVLASARRP